MKKCYIDMLAMIITNKCNLDCGHCLHGKKDNTTMSNEVIKSSLDQIKGIGTLTICGGEATLALDRLEYIINYIITNKILVEELTITINGTIYSEYLLELLKEIDSYINEEGIRSSLAISYDKYHIEEMKKLGILEEYFENIKKYMESKYFYSLRELTEKPFREGNAEKLKRLQTVPLRSPKKFITYVNKDHEFDKNGLCLIGPLVSVNTHGIITECDASEIHQASIYNYGSVFKTSFENSALNNKAKILTPKEFFPACKKEWKRYLTYKK